MFIFYRIWSTLFYRPYYKKSACMIIISQKEIIIIIVKQLSATIENVSFY